MAQKPVRSPLERMELQEFSKRLVDLMNRRGMSQSDVARALWGDSETGRGARNRDRLSHYVRGSQMPEPKTMAALAKVLGVAIEDLNPALDKRAEGRATEEPMLTMVGGRPDLALLNINRIVPMTTAVEILSLLVKDSGKSSIQ